MSRKKLIVIEVISIDGLVTLVTINLLKMSPKFKMKLTKFGNY